MTDPSIADFTAAHCIRREDGVLVVSPGAVVTFTPTGQFFEMKIAVEGRTVASAVLHKTAFKITREDQGRNDSGGQ